MFKPHPPFLRFNTDPAPAGGGATVTETPAPAAPPAPAPATTDPAPSAEKVEDLPEWAQRVIRDTRKEAGDYRTKAQTAADDAQKAFADKIAVALGLKPDAAQDPAALTTALTAEKSESIRAKRELAVFKAASSAGADPSKLLDRASFLTSIAGIDPSDGNAIKTAIEAAVTADQTLKAARAAGASTVETPGGTGEQGQITEAQLAQMTPEQIAAAYEKGQLNGLL